MALADSDTAGGPPEFEDFGLRPRPSPPNAEGDPARDGNSHGERQPDSGDPLIGADLGGFRVVRLIAEGGMGRVYEGVQETPRRPVAIKVMRPGCLSSDAARRFENEWEVLGKLRHPNIAQIYFAGKCDVLGTKVPYFVMEFIPDALPITKYANARKLSTAERLELFGKVCEAVAHGHRQGVVHRDLKPSNILIEPSGTPKVIDFGVARNVDADPEHVTQITGMGDLIGTVQYMSPEQFTADPSKIDQRTDVYALGVILYELLAGKPPYELRKKHIVEAARVVREYRPPSPAKLNGNVTPGMVSIASKCLQKDRRGRYSTAAELATAVAQYLDAQAESPQSRANPSGLLGEWLERLRRVPKMLRPRDSFDLGGVASRVGWLFVKPVLSTATILVSVAFTVLGAVIIGDVFKPAQKTAPVLPVASAANVSSTPDAKSARPPEPVGTRGIGLGDRPRGQPRPAPTVPASAAATDQAAQGSPPVAVPAPLPSAAAPQPVPAAGEVFLCDLAPILVQLGHGTLQPPGVLEDGLLLRVADRATPHGIVAYPFSNGSSRLMYLVPEGAERFLATAAIDDSVTGKITPLTFRVLDETNRELWRSPQALDGESQPVSCDVKLAGSSAIVLQVDCPGSHSWTRAVWVEPRFVTPSVGAPTGGPVATMPKDALRWGGHGYYFFPDVVTQQDAMRKCRGMGGHLARIESADEHRLVMAAFEGLTEADPSGVDPRYWIDGNDGAKEGEWTFADGTPMRFVGWRQGEPNSEAEDEDGLQIMNGGWNDIGMNRRYGFICEWDGVPTPAQESPEAAIASVVPGWQERLRTWTADRVPKSARPLPDSVEPTNLNDPRNWVISHGTWQFTESGRLRGEGDSAIRFRRGLPGPVHLSFKLRVISGMRTRVHLGGTDMFFANEGYEPTFWLYGQVRDISGKPFAYKPNTTYEITIKTVGDTATLLIDGKEIGSVAVSKSPENVKLELCGGDGWSPGTTEFWGFRWGAAEGPNAGN